MLTPARRGFLASIAMAIIRAHTPSSPQEVARKGARNLAEVQRFIAKMMSGGRQWSPSAINGGQRRTRTIRAKRMHASGRSNTQSRKYA